MSINLSQRAGFPAELSTAVTGSYTSVGSLLYNPVIITFYNGSSDAATLSVDGSTTWKTFAGGEYFQINLRENHGAAPNFTMDINTTFYVKGTADTGDFYISYLYAK